MALCPFCSSELQSSGGGDASLAGCVHCLNPLLLVSQSGQITAAALPGAVDIRQMAPKGSLGGELLGMLPEALDDLSVLPEVAQRVLAASQDPDIGLSEMGALIGEDAVLAMKVLQLANSALYGGLSAVRDLPTACARLGMKQVTNAVEAVAFGRLYSVPSEEFKALAQQLWRHAVAAAHCASAIAGMTAQPGADMLFVAGLVHEIGRLAAITAIGRATSGGLVQLRQSPELLQEVLDAWQPLLSLHAVQRWGLPTELVVAAYFHHKPESVPHDAWLPSAHVVSLSCAIANACGYHTGMEEESSLVSHPSAGFLGLTDLKLATLQVDLEDLVQPMFDLVAS